MRAVEHEGSGDGEGVKPGAVEPEGLLSSDSLVVMLGPVAMRLIRAQPLNPFDKMSFTIIPRHEGS